MSGKWGVVNPKWTKEVIKQTFNRGYGQPVVTGGFTGYWEKTSRWSYLARRYDWDWMKQIAMRIDSQKYPLTVVRRQIWMLRLEYWLRKTSSVRAQYRAAKVEWAYIKPRLKQPFTWTGHDLLHGSFWCMQLMAAFVLGEIICRRDEFGYDVGVATDWFPSRPRFAPGVFHVHGVFGDYPWEKQSSHVARGFQRGYWPNNDDNYYFTRKLSDMVPWVPCW